MSILISYVYHTDRIHRPTPHTRVRRLRKDLPPRSSDDPFDWYYLLDWPGATSKVLLNEMDTALISFKAKVVEQNVKKRGHIYRGELVVQPVDEHDFTNVVALIDEQEPHLDARIAYKPIDKNGRMALSFRAPYSDKEVGATSVSAQTVVGDPLGCLRAYDASTLEAADEVSVVIRLEALPSVVVQDDYDIAFGILSVCKLIA